MTQAKRFVLIMNATDRSKATAALFATHVWLPIPALKPETWDVHADVADDPGMVARARAGPVAQCGSLPAPSFGMPSGGARVANTLDGC